MTEPEMSRLETMIANLGSRFEARFDRVDARLDRIDVRLDGFDVRFEGVDGRFNRIEVLFEGLRGDVRLVAEGLGALTEKVDRIESVQGEMAEKLEFVAAGVRIVRTDVRDLTERMTRLEG